MRIPQSLDEVRRMSPDEQRQAGEMLGRLMILGPEQLSQVTKITPEELQGMIQPVAPPGQQEPAGDAIPTQPMPVKGYAGNRMPARRSDRNLQGHYGVLSNLVQEPEGLQIKDTRTGAARPAQAGDKVGPTEVLMSGNQILKAGLRAQANLRIQSQKRV